MPEREHITLENLPQLQRIGSITLGEMDSVKLLNRIDTKYLTDERTLAEILSDAAEAGYRALETEGSKVAGYDSIYFDTPGLRMYLDHHNRRLTRQKVRTREYMSSGAAFLEIKLKNNHGRTKKKRTGIPEEDFRDFRGNAGACSYLSSHSAFSAGELSPSLETLFRRITLVNPAMTERITLDSSVCFTNLRTGRQASLRDGVVIEVKQDGRAGSGMKAILLDRRVKPLRVSKYCIGVALTDPSVKSGRFKTKIRLIEKQINKRLI
ncbi:MAG: polyphosphate polymerase domain-containing protein [Bacteroidales bacterium]|nr:polyphosphate polymerase domain-containing protein [Bacteroidales bacterium]